jgi:hypothetical protein
MGAVHRGFRPCIEARPMHHFLTKVLDHIFDAIRIFALSIVSVVMLSVGLMLALGGRPEGLIPLVLGSLAAFNLLKLGRQLYRNVTGMF